MKKPGMAPKIREDYPKAISINVGCKTGDYYHIYSEEKGIYLGKGKSKKEAWRAAYKNINS